MYAASCAAAEQNMTVHNSSQLSEPAWRCCANCAEYPQGWLGHFAWY